VPFNKPVRRIAIIGTGVIGASWSAFYLARGFNVVATDPAPHAEEKLRRYVDPAWKGLSTLGLATTASPNNLEFTADIDEGADRRRLRSGKRPGACGLQNQVVC
jgi:carnitine 3-dehydrogenase